MIAERRQRDCGVVHGGFWLKREGRKEFPGARGKGRNPRPDPLELHIYIEVASSCGWLLQAWISRARTLHASLHHFAVTLHTNLVQSCGHVAPRRANFMLRRVAPASVMGANTSQEDEAPLPPPPQLPPPAPPPSPPPERAASPDLPKAADQDVALEAPILVRPSLHHRPCPRRCQASGFKRFLKCEA